MIDKIILITKLQIQTLEILLHPAFDEKCWKKQEKEETRLNRKVKFFEKKRSSKILEQELH